uniref:DUF4220 domain-containing protein n=1 Tax=Leersia perrieri TaxID=77586 RepID=A0A0D9XU71_9ORYZ
MVNPREVVKSWFITLQEDIYVLIRIESLVSLVTATFLIMFIMDIFLARSRSRGSGAMSMFDKVDRFSDRIVLYLLGAMQVAPFDNSLFPVWSIVLVSLHGSIGYISGYGVSDRIRRVAEMGNVIKFLGVAFLTSTQGSQFQRPLWSMWALLLLRSVHRFGAQRNIEKSLWHGRSSELIPEYMRDDHDSSQFFRGAVLDAATMEGYKYLVHGESKQNIRLLKPRYVLYLDIINQDSMVTLDRIWRSDGPVLQYAVSVHGDNSKDLGLAFALSRFLRCRFEDVTLHPHCFSMSRSVIMKQILNEDQNADANQNQKMQNAERAFRIMELEIFVNKEPPEDDLVHFVHGHNVDVYLTWLFMFFMVLKEIWEITTYVLSEWTKLLLACGYTRFFASEDTCFRWIRNAMTAKMLGCFLKSKISDPWHGRLDQCEFIQSFDYKPSLRRIIMYHATLGLVKLKDHGEKLGTDIKIPACVKLAILDALNSMNINTLGSYLPKQIPLFRGNPMLLEQFQWALLDLQTCSQVVLVWHIATSMCEIKLAKDKGLDLTKPGFLRSTFTYLKSLVCFWLSPQPYLVDENILVGDKLRTSYTIANSLSRYCTYLMCFQSDLLPDSLIVPSVIFDTTISAACEAMDGCNSLESKYDRLNAMLVPETAEEVRMAGILQKAVKLGKQLLDIHDDEQRWKILESVWANLLVHMAPSWNAEAHKNSLEYGGELITFIWGLLWHCGIKKSNLWNDPDEAPGNTNSQPQSGAIEPRGAHNVQDDVMMNNDQNGIQLAHDEADVQNQPSEQAAEADVEIAEEAQEDEPEPGNGDHHAQFAADMEIAAGEAQEEDSDSELGNSIHIHTHFDADVEIAADEAHEEESKTGNNVQTHSAADVEIADEAQEQKSEPSNNVHHSVRCRRGVCR